MEADALKNLFFLGLVSNAFFINPANRNNSQEVTLNFWMWELRNSKKKTMNF